MPTRDPKTILVSNRLPLTIVRSADGFQIKRSSGGLVSALSPLHKVSNSIWIGYAGELVDQQPQLKEQLGNDRFFSVGISKKLYSAYYNGLSNGGIWPLFHYFPTLCEFRESDWLAYKEVNARFCEAILRHAEENDFVWVHDYHLMLLPSLLRTARPDLRIGYFHHIPFPASEVFRVLPWRLEILEGLLGADVVGFHTLEYARHFVNAVARHIGCDSRGDEIHCGSRIVKVGAFPLGIDTETLLEPTNSDEFQKKELEYKEAWQDKILILGLDRLDYTKGIKERLLAFAEFLKRNPSLASRVVLLQVSVPSRVDVLRYGDLRSEVERLVGKINGEFGTPTHAPVQYIFKSVDKVELCALYRRADICLITPLRDGLNLVCKEYVALKENLDGMLVLSEFVGASEEMGEAILVNPYDTTATAQAIELAINMPPEERRSRMKALHERVFSFDSASWASVFADALNESVEQNTKIATRELDEDDYVSIETYVEGARQVLLAIDFESLFPLDWRRYDARAYRQKTLELLTSLSHIEGLKLAVITSQSKEYCRNTLSNLNAWLAAEFGAFLLPPDHSEWRSMAPGEEFETIKPEILRIFERCVLRVPGSRVEIIDSAILWHYRRTRSSFAQSLALETAHVLNGMLNKSLFHCVIGRNGLEVRPTLANKGTAIDFVAQEIGMSNSDLLITIGDNRTDEHMFRTHPEQNLSINVGPPSVFARLTLHDHKELGILLARFVEMFDSLLPLKNKETNADVPTRHHRQLSDSSSGEPLGRH